MLPIEKENFAAEDMGITKEGDPKKVRKLKIPVAYYNPNKPFDDLELLKAQICPEKSVGVEHEIRQRRGAENFQ